jgi:monoterpene epsilon-lactone hydrolase
VIDESFIHLAARDLPFPKSVSPQAKNALEAQYSQPARVYPDQADTAAWLRAQAEVNEALNLAFLSRRVALEEHIKSQPIDMGGASGFLSSPRVEPGIGRILFDIHGGGLTCGNGEICGGWGSMWSKQFGAPTYSVDYRLPPLHPYPAALDDCLTAYRFLLERFPPEEIVVQGLSAGGNLAAALMLLARDHGLPFPAGLILGSPEVDLTESGDSFKTNLGVDTVLKQSLMPANLLYAGGFDLTAPYLSPLFGDFAKGFPPTLITTGTRDLFLSNSVRLHNAVRRAGNHSEFLIEEAMPHGGLGGSPEDQALAADIKNFAERAWKGLLHKI